MIRRRMVRIALTIVLSAAACGANEGVPPPADRFFYPTGLVVSPDGRFLFVANSNFDIAFNGGSLVTVDLQGVHERIAARPSADAPREEISEESLLVPGSAVQIGTFANELVLSADGRRLFASVRGDGSVTFADVGDDGNLVCADQPSGNLPECRGRFVLGRAPNDRGLELGREPHALALHPSGRLFVTDADDGGVAMFETAFDTPALTNVSDEFPRGSSAIALRPGTTSESDDFLAYVTSRDAPSVVRFGVVADAGISVDRTTSIDFLGAGGVDQRGIAFSPDYAQAYLVSRFPESLLVLDTAVDDSGRPADEFVAAIEVAAGPAVVSVDPTSGLVYVVCFRAGQIFVVDPFLLSVVDILLTGIGPHLLAFDPTRPVAYLAQFTESTIAVLDVDPASETFHEFLLTIGIPDPPGS